MSLTYLDVPPLPRCPLPRWQGKEGVHLGERELIAFFIPLQLSFNRNASVRSVHLPDSINRLALICTASLTSKWCHTNCETGANERGTSSETERGTSGETERGTSDETERGTSGETERGTSGETERGTSGETGANERGTSGETERETSGETGANERGTSGETAINE